MLLRALAAQLLCAVLLAGCTGKSTDRSTSSAATATPQKPPGASDLPAVSQEPPSPTVQLATARPAPVNGLTAIYSLKAQNGINGTQFDVYINGIKASTLSNAGESDITTFMHKGANRVRVTWSVTANAGSGTIVIGEDYKGHWNTAASLVADYANTKGDKTIMITGR